MFHAIYEDRVRSFYDIDSLAQEVNMTIDVFGETVDADDFDEDDEDFGSLSPCDMGKGDFILSKNVNDYYRTYVAKDEADTLPEVIAKYCGDHSDPVAICDVTADKVFFSDSSVYSIAAFIAEGASTVGVEDEVVDQVFALSGLYHRPYVRRGGKRRLKNGREIKVRSCVVVRNNAA